MTTRTWVDPHSGHRASAWSNPGNWTPYGTPQAGDTLRMPTGRMTIEYSTLPAELHLGPASGHLSTGPITLNMVNGNATVGVRGNTYLNFDPADPLTVTANGTDHLAADNLSAVKGTVDVAANSSLVVTGNMTFAYNGHLEGPGTITNNGFISIAQGDISAHVNGHGTLQLHAYHDGLGIQTITGAIDGGQDVQLTSGASGGTRTELVNPSTFKGTVEVAPPVVGALAYNNLLEVDGVHASRMDIRNDMLRLYGTGNKPLWQVHEHMPAGYTASMTDTATGTEITFAPPPRQLLG